MKPTTRQISLTQKTQLPQDYRRLGQEKIVPNTVDGGPVPTGESRLIGDDSGQRHPNLFASWRDMVLSPTVLLGTMGLAVFIAWKCHATWGWDLFSCCLVFAAANFVIATGFLRLLTAVAGLKPGTYSRERNPWTVYAYNLYSMVATTNLFHFIENNLLIPPVFKSSFYKLLGTKCGKGFIMVAGQIRDPFLVSIGSDVVVGTGALILGHYYSASRQLRLGKVEIRRGALIGVNAVIFPNCTVGENATVAPGAVLVPGTIVPANEVWAGNPAQKNEKLTARARATEESSSDSPVDIPLSR